ncbi:MAG: efflux RND transporter permease subunit [Peptococcaceae bacterium]
MRLSDLAVKRPVAILMIVLVVLLLGGVSLTRLAVDLFPELNLPVAVTVINYEGVGPEEIEQIITKPIEGQLSTLTGIDSISSRSSQGTSLVITQFKWGTNMDQTLIDLRDKVNQIKSYLPDEVSEPMIMKIDINATPVVDLGVTGEQDLDQLKKIVEDKIQPRLERIPGVASVQISGGKTREIQVEMDPYKLQAYDLTLNDITTAISSENHNISGGYLEEGEKDYLLRIKGEFTSIQDLEDIMVTLKTGENMPLKDLSEIRDTYREVDSFTLINGTPSIAVSIQKQSDANTVDVSDRVQETVRELEKELPEKVSIKVASDQAEFIRQAISRVVQNGLIGAVLAVVILFLFLRNMRSTMIIGTAIPISVITTFILMYFGGLTLNLISLGGLALGIGMMVDNAIVILENIYRYRQQGYSRIEAAKQGAAEVASAIVASTLTTVAVFLPIIFVEGIASQIFKPMALTVSFSLIASLLVALTLIPMLSSKYLKVEKNGNGSPLKRISKLWLKLLDALDEKYRALLGWALKKRKTVIFATLIALIISIALIPRIGMEFIPEQDSGQFSISVNLPNNSVLERTEKVLSRVEAIVSEIPEVETVFTSVGSGGGFSLGGGKSTHQGNISVELVPVSRRTRGIQEILDEIREKTAVIPGADISLSAESMSMGSSQAAVSLSIKGYDLDVLQNLADQIAAKVKEVPGTREVTTSLEEGSPEIAIALDRQKAAEYGISTYQAAQSLRMGIQGATASRYRTGGEEIDIKVILKEANRQNIEDLKRIMVPTMQGANIPLEEIAEIRYETGPSTITRTDQSREVTITGDLSGRDLNSVMQDITGEIAAINMPVGYEVEVGGSNQDMLESFQSLGLALILAVILVYMILAAQFESLLYPFIIMFSLPPTLIGIVGGLLITGRTLSVPTFIGIIMLAGIVVNNAIVLVDYINTLRKRGLEKLEAILEAGPTRLRPILMTTLTTVLALIPQALGIGEGAEVSAPMATAVVAGLSFSTLITLVLIPVTYYILDEIGAKRKKRSKKSAEELTAE